MRTLLCALLLPCVLLTACASGETGTTTAAESPEETAAPDQGTDEETAGQDGAVEEETADGQLQRIVSLSPTATEMLFAIGAGDQVVAVDDQSNYPEQAPTTDLSGFQPNVEAIAGYDPDLVVLANDTEDVVSGLEAVGVEVLLLPAAATLDDTYDQIAELGIVTGNEDEAADLVASMRSEVDALVAEVPERPEPLTFYHELDDQLYSVTSDTFIGQVYELAGLTNVADAADPDGAAGGYPQLAAEFLVEQDPDLIFLADVKCCGQSAETVAQRPGFDALTAVQEGRVVELDDDVASRWGPRVVEFLREVVNATAEVPVG